MSTARNHHWIPAAHLGLFGSSLDHVFGDEERDERPLRFRPVEALDIGAGKYIGRITPDAVLKQRDLYTTTHTSVPDAFETAKIPIENAGRQVMLELDRMLAGDLRLTDEQREGLAAYVTLLWSQDPGTIASKIQLQQHAEWLMLVVDGFSEDQATEYIMTPNDQRQNVAVQSTFQLMPDIAATVLSRRVQVLRRSSFPWWSINDAGVVSIRSDRTLFEPVGVGDDKVLLFLPATPRSLIVLSLDDGPEVVRHVSTAQAMNFSVPIWQTAHRFVFARSRADIQAIEMSVPRELLNVATPRVWRPMNAGPIVGQRHAHRPFRRRWTSLTVSPRATTLSTRHRKPRG